MSWFLIVQAGWHHPPKKKRMISGDLNLKIILPGM